MPVFFFLFIWFSSCLVVKRLQRCSDNNNYLHLVYYSFLHLSYCIAFVLIVKEIRNTFEPPSTSYIWKYIRKLVLFSLVLCFICVFGTNYNVTYIGLKELLAGEWKKRNETKQNKTTTKILTCRSCFCFTLLCTVILPPAQPHTLITLPHLYLSLTVCICHNINGIRSVNTLSWNCLSREYMILNVCNKYTHTYSHTEVSEQWVVLLTNQHTISFQMYYNLRFMIDIKHIM